jgi:streptogramin lyase
MNPKPTLARRLAVRLAVAVAVCAAPSAALSQIFVSSYHAVDTGIIHDTVSSIGKYNLDGTPIDASLISYGLDAPNGITVSGSSLFVTGNGFGYGTYVQKYTVDGSLVNPTLVPGILQSDVAVSGSNLYVSQASAIGKYTMAGLPVNNLLVTGLNGPYRIALPEDGTHVFVTISGDGKVGEYDTATGAAINASLIAGLIAPTGIAISGSHLFVANSGSGTIGEYNLDGSVVNAALVTGLSNPLDIVILNNDLYVVNNGTNSIGEYDATTGAAINAALITGLDNPQGLAVIPEPASWLLLAVAGSGLLAMRRAFSASHGLCL